MKKIFVCVMFFILLASFVGCKNEIANQADDTALCQTITREPDMVKETVPQQPSQTEQAEQAEQPQTQQYVEEEQEQLPCSAFNLPKSIDPLGVFANEDIFIMRPELAILKYDAWPATYDDLYVIEGVEIGRDTLPIINIKTNDEDKVEYVETRIYSADPKFIFEQMLMIYGEPSINKYYDIETGETLELQVEEFGNGSGHNDQWVIWEVNGYYIRLVYGGASGYYGSHVEIIKSKDELRNMWDLNGTLRRVINDENSCMMSDANELFDPTGIFRNEKIFDMDLEDVVLKYGATQATQSEDKLSMREYTQNYFTEGLTICGQDAKLIIDHSNPKFKELPESLDRIGYVIDVNDLKQGEIEELVEDISELISGSYGEHTKDDGRNAIKWINEQTGKAATVLYLTYSENVQEIAISMYPLLEQ